MAGVAILSASGIAEVAAGVATDPYRVTRHPNGTTHIQHSADLSEAFYGTDDEADAWLASQD